MYDLSVLGPAVTHQLYDAATRASGRRASTDVRDRGAVSLEQVLWFVAAGVSVAVIAAILWNNIRDEANTPIDTPTAPTP